MTRPFFVTGSGTDIGKTYVTAALIAGLGGRGRRVDAIKPVLSGYDPDTPNESDTGVLARALGRDLSSEIIALMTPWRYSAALSPDMAAAREGLTIPVQDVIAYARGTLESSSADVLFCEGAGGVLVPLDSRNTIRDLIAALGWPVILVGGTYLGAISHTLTAIEALRGRAPLATVVLSESPVSPVPPNETAAAIARFTPEATVYVVARGGDAPASLLDFITM